MALRVTSRGRTLGLAALAICILALDAGSVPTARAQGSADGTFSITPSRRDLVGRPPLTLVPTRVSNTTQDSYDVRVFPVLLTQNLTGAFQFDESPRPLDAARRILSASPVRFRLAPGASRDVRVRWELLPLDARAAYIGVIFQGQRVLKSGQSVPVISRLLSVNFLRLPGHYHPKGAFTALRALQAAPRVLRLLPRVKNTGDVIASPRNARLAIHDASGHTVYKTSWKGDVVLPGAQRDFPVEVRRVLPAGRYTAQAVMSFGARRRAEISTAFTLVGPNRLPTPGVDVRDFAAHGDIGHVAHVSGHVLSTGTSPASLDLRLSLFRLTGGQASAKPIATRRARFSALAPKTRRDLDVDLGRSLAKGQYRVVASYTDATNAPHQLTSDFEATRHRGFFDRLHLFFDRHRLAIVLVIVAIVLGLLVFLLLRRQRRLEEELRDARAQREQDPPPGAPSG
jgi:P pilus assembly chaperone PapD